MSNTIEHLQILYEIAISIGSSLDLRPMLKNSLAVLLKKLNCSAGGVFFPQPHSLSTLSSNDLREIYYEEVFTIPRSNAHNKAYQAAKRQLPKLIPADREDSLFQQLPLSGQEDPGSYFYILELPDIGLLILTKYGEGLDPDILKSLKLLMSKLAGACKACLQNTALHESETRYRSLFEASADGIVIVDVETKMFKYANPALCRMLGYTDEGLKTLGLADIHLKQDLQWVIAEFEAQARGDQTLALDIPCLRKDGRIVYADINTANITIDGRRNIMGIFRDTTERKRMEEKLKKLSSVVENATDHVFITDYEGVIEYINPAFERLTGYTKDDAIGKTPRILKSGKKTQEEYRQLWETVRAGNIFQGTVINRKKNGELYYEEKIITPIRGERGNITHFVSTGRDITERTRAEETMRHLAAIVESSDDAVIGKTLDGIITSWNYGAEKIYGYSADEIVGRSISLLVPLEQKDELPNILKQIKQGIPIEHSDTVRVKKDGSRINVSITVSPIHDGAEKIVGASTIASDITERKRAEEALRETTDYLESLLSFANTPIMVWDNNHRITKFNLEFERLTGYTMYDVLGQYPKMLVPADNQQTALSLLTRTSEGENLLSIELPVRCKDGSVRTVLWNTANIYSADSKTIIATIAHGQDITERKRSEEAREHREAELEESQRIARIGSWEWTPATGVVKWSDGLNHVLARDRDLPTPTFDAISQFYTPESWQRLGVVISRAVETGASYDLELEMIRADGATCWTTTRGEAIRGEDGTVVKLRGSVHDITESKRAKEALQESELRFRSLYENATIGLYRTTPDGKILLANPALVEILGYTSFEKIVERNLEKDGFESSSQRKEFLEKIERDGEVNGYESKWTRQDGKIIFVLESARAIRDSQGKTLYYDGTVEDITNHRQLEEQMRQMQKLESLGTLAGGIAHDFNNILGIILAYVSVLNRMKNDPEKLQSAVETISTAVERGATLVRQILTFARKSDVEFGLISINDVAKEVIGMILETFPRTLTYSQNLQKDIPAINADRSQIHQALLNLCVNARDAMPDGGVLTINTSIVDGITLHDQHPDALASPYICVEISDTGEGMTAEVRNRIFEPFFTTKEKGKGTGLGLAVVFGVIQTHKGFAEVASELGKGTAFRLYLPVPSAIKPVQTEIQEIVKEIPGGTETLLVVEDEEALMMFVQMSLAAKGYTVIPAVDGPEAVKTYRERHKEISMVFTDLGLPGMTGMEEINIIKKINPDVKIIVATGFLDPEMKSELLKSGVKKFIFKPYNFEEILKLLREVLDEK